MGRDHRDEVESEVTLKFLHAFRRCVRAGERLLVIDWLHPWFYFDPFGGVAKATRDEWAYPLLPDYLEAYWFLAPDFRFGVLVTTGLAIFGEDLLNAISVDPPVQFLNVCRFRRKADRKRWRKLLVRQM